MGCAQALLLWNQNIKAHYRKVKVIRNIYLLDFPYNSIAYLIWYIKCLLQVRRPEAALKAVEEGLSVAGDETTELLALKTQVLTHMGSMLWLNNNAWAQCEKELSRLARLREEANAARLAMERKWSEVTVYHC